MPSGLKADPGAELDCPGGVPVVSQLWLGCAAPAAPADITTTHTTDAKKQLTFLMSCPRGSGARVRFYAHGFQMDFTAAIRSGSARQPSACAQVAVGPDVGVSRQSFRGRLIECRDFLSRE